MKKRLRRNAVLYYAMQMLVLGIPILLIPYLSRVLGLQGFGLISMGQAFAGLVFSVIEYGFQITATRQVAARTERGEDVSDILSSVMSAKFLLAAIFSFFGGISLWVVPAFRDNQSIFLIALVYGILQGFSFSWLFTGQQRYKMAASLDFSAQLLSLLLIVGFVHSPNDAWLALTCYATAQAIIQTIAGFIAYRSHQFRPFSLAQARSELKRGRFVFFQHVIGTFYVRSSSLLLGLVATPQAVGIFAGADKILRGTMIPIAPLRQLFLPIMSARLARSEDSAVTLLWQLVLGTQVIALMIGGLLFFFAEPLVRLILGPELAPAANLLRLFALLPAIIFALEIFTVLWMLPRHQDAQLTKITMATLVVSIVLGLGLGALMTWRGTGLAVLLTNVFTMVLVVRSITQPGWRKLLPSRR
ncbi:MAG: oligosaccharide flippase family protein [Alphaproteobacteria bacterium]|nr:oligosaccharide flippase family protein [Alphaproteobacteria bacterium]